MGLRSPRCFSDPIRWGGLNSELNNLSLSLGVGRAGNRRFWGVYMAHPISYKAKPFWKGWVFAPRLSQWVLSYLGGGLLDKQN